MQSAIENFTLCVAEAHAHALNTLVQTHTHGLRDGDKRSDGLAFLLEHLKAHTAHVVVYWRSRRSAHNNTESGAYSFQGYQTRSVRNGL